MKSLVALTAAVLLAGTAHAQTAQVDRYIHAGKLIDRPGQAPRGASTIAVKGGKVVGVYDGYVAPLGEAPVVDLKDRTVLPGLIDSHGHVMGIGFGALTLDLASHEVTFDGEPVKLSAREFSVLRALLDNPGSVVSKSQLEEKLYSWKDEVNSNAVEVYIHGLRKKLGAELIQNVRGLGYMVPKL